MRGMRFRGTGWIAHGLGAALTLLLVGACNGPLPFMAGGALAGEERAAPAAWSFEEPFGVVQLETRPREPYSVNIAYTLMDGQLYVNAGDTRTAWVRHIESNPAVRLRAGGLIYPLRAERVVDADEIAAFGALWTAQGVFHRDPARLDPVWIYRLVARSPAR